MTTTTEKGDNNKQHIYIVKVPSDIVVFNIVICSYFAEVITMGNTQNATKATLFATVSSANNSSTEENTRKSNSTKNSGFSGLRGVEEVKEWENARTSCQIDATRKVNTT